MRDFILRWLYKRYLNQFNEFFIEEFIGKIPKDLRAPSMEFLARGRERLERFFSIQAYSIQRRSIADPKNAERYEGMLIEIRFLLSIIQKGSVVKDSFIEKEVEKDFSEGVDDFLEKGKEFINKKTK